MLGLSFSKLPKNRRFNYKPIYYDKSKEDLDRNVALAKRKYKGETLSAEETKDRIHELFDRRHRREYHVFNDNNLYKLRVVAIVIILGAISYVVWESSLMDKFIRFFMNG